MDNNLKRVRQFHDTFRVDRADLPSIPADNICQLRIDLIQEELNELKEAFAKGDIIGVADALGDLSVVVDGTYDVCGLAEYKEPISAEIFASNMSKADENGNPIFRQDGKVLKGPNYFKPDLKKILED